MVARVFFIAAVTLLACGCQRQSAPPLTPDQARAIAVARNWVKANGRDPDAATYEASPAPSGTGWKVSITNVPAMAGGHTLLILDAHFAVVDVGRGA
jgi:hypothetical protein